MFTRTVWRAVIGTMAICTLLVGAGIAHAQVANDVPQITSAPVLTVVAGDTYTYPLTASDNDGDTLTWTLSVAPDGMTLDDQTIVWHPTTVGTYNVVVEVTDGNNGYDSQSWQVTVIPGAVARITVMPNDRPTVVIVGSHKQFVATAYDAYGNLVTTPNITWSTDPAYGSVSSDGFFTAEHGGVTYVAAQNGEVKQSNGVIVSDVGAEILLNANTATPTNTNTATNENVNDETNANTNTATEEEAPTNENTNAENESVIEEGVTTTPESEEMIESTEGEEEPCVNMAHWAIIVILIVYGLLLVIYYRYEKTSPTNAWWILPTLLTIIALIIYYQNICPGEYLWWPWTMVGIGAIATIYYKGRRENPSDSSNDDSQTHLPL